MAEHPKKKSGRKTFTTKGFGKSAPGSKKGEKPSRISDGTTARKIQRPSRNDAGKQAGRGKQKFNIDGSSRSIFQGKPRGSK